MAQTEPIRIFSIDARKVDKLVDGIKIQNRPQAFHSIVEKAEKYDYMMAMEENDLK